MSKAAKILALCIDMGTASSPSFKRVCKSTTLTVAQNPQTEEYDYIADEVKTTELTAYAPTIEQDLAIIKGEPDYDFMFARYKTRAVGTAAHIPVLLIYVLEGDNTAGYYTEKWDAVLSFTDYNATEGKLNFSLALCGTPFVGTSVITAGVAQFTAASAG